VPQAFVQGRDVRGTRQGCQDPFSHTCSPGPQLSAHARVAPGSLHASGNGNALRAPQLAKHAHAPRMATGMALRESMKAPSSTLGRRRAPKPSARG
jgi:hypothetical protein